MKKRHGPGKAEAEAERAIAERKAAMVPQTDVQALSSRIATAQRKQFQTGKREQWKKMHPVT